MSLAAVDASLTGTTGEDEEVRMRRCVEGLSFSEHR